jgi:hypothetical protein
MDADRASAHFTGMEDIVEEADSEEDSEGAVDLAVEVEDSRAAEAQEAPGREKRL